MRKIYALYGISNSGKTSTLKIVHELLSKNADSNLSNYQIIGDDIREILIINGVKVGIET